MEGKNIEKKVMTIEYTELSNVLNVIQKDVFFLQESGVYPDDIRVAIPNFWHRILDQYLQKSSEQLATHVYGAKIIEGYNNEICVFDAYAAPGSPKCEVIHINYE